MNTIGTSTSKPLSVTAARTSPTALPARPRTRSAQPNAPPTRRSIVFPRRSSDVRSQAAPLLNKVSSQPERRARGMEAVRDTSQQLRERAQQAQDMTVAHVNRDEPIRRCSSQLPPAPLMGLISLARTLARLSAMTRPTTIGLSRRAPIMIHLCCAWRRPEPHLLGDHVEAYAALVGEEVHKVSTSWAMRIGPYVGALLLALLGLGLVGVALLLWAALPSRRTIPRRGRW